MRIVLRVAVAFAALATPLQSPNLESVAGAPSLAPSPPTLVPGPPDLIPGPPGLAPGPPDLVRTPFQAGTPYVDGISDQSLPAWDGSFAASRFASLFRATWDAVSIAPAAPHPLRQGTEGAVGGPAAHISLARYVVQWNVMSGAYPDYLARLRAWYRDVLDLGLAPDLSLASYDGSLPGSIAAYRAALQALLGRFPATAYVEAWDEPNGASRLAPATAAAYTLAAASLCGASGCMAIAGSFLDSPNLVAYERAYERALAPIELANWGIHPYRAVATRDAAAVLAFKAALPHGGAGERVWFTEIGAYRCEGGALPRTFGEAAQARAAAWLVDRLMPLVQPVHVFYYELLYRDDRPPPCDRSDSDTALYAPVAAPAQAAGGAPAAALGGGGSAGAEAPRAAAFYIQDDRPAPALAPSAPRALAGSG